MRTKKSRRADIGAYGARRSNSPEYSIAPPVTPSGRSPVHTLQYRVPLDKQYKSAEVNFAHKAKVLGLGFKSCTTSYMDSSIMCAGQGPFELGLAHRHRQISPCPLQHRAQLIGCATESARDRVRKVDGDEVGVDIVHEPEHA